MMCWDKAEFTTHKAVVFQLPFPAGRWHCHSKRGGGQTGAVGSFLLEGPAFSKPAASV